MSLEPNYSHCCPPDDSFLSSPEFLNIGVHLVTCFSVPFSIYGGFCILKVTPKQMSNAKWVLLNVHIWTVVLDIVFNFLSIPMMFFPSSAGLMLGWGPIIGIPPKFLLYLIQALVSVWGSAAVSLFENRQNVIQTRYKIRRRWIRILMNVMNYLVATVTVIPPYLEEMDVEALKFKVLEKIPCLPPSFFTSNVFILTANPTFATLLMAIQTLFYFPQVGFFTIHTWYHLVFVHSSRVSRETRKMQLKFLIGSLLQCSIPAVVFMNPIFYIWFSVNTGYFNQEINNLLIFTVSFHGLLSTLCMIAVHRSYRNHFITSITFGKVQQASVKVSFVRSMSHQ